MNAACSWLLLFPESLADPKDVSIRMTYVHLAHVPWFVRRRPGDLEPLLNTVFVDLVDVIDPDRHPDALIVCGLLPEGRRQIALSPAALPVLAEEDLAVAGADTAKCRRLAPVPALLPAEALKPGEALLDVRDVQDGRDSFRKHDILSRTPDVLTRTENATSNSGSKRG